MRIDLGLAQQRMPWSELVARAQFADDAGFDGIWGFDHFQPMYGSGPGECFEGWTTLAARPASQAGCDSVSLSPATRTGIRRSWPAE